MARLVVFAGLPGSGKSTIARELARQLGAAWLRIDTIETAIADEATPITDEGYRRLSDTEVAAIADRVIAARMNRPDGPAAALT